MAANEASRLSSKAERPAGRPEEESTAIAKLRELTSEPRGAGADASTAGEESAAPEQQLEELERAADGIRPSWHGTEVGPSPVARPRAIGLPPVPVTPFPAALPPPAPLPMFEAFPIDQPAPLYSADSTVRTAALLPERLAHLLNQPQIAGASRWLRARPWLRAGLGACALLGLLALLWPSSAPDSHTALTTQSKALPPPALPAPSAVAPLTTQAAPSESQATKASEKQAPPPMPSAKKRDKRAGRATGKPLAGKARDARKASKPSAPAR